VASTGDALFRGALVPGADGVLLAGTTAVATAIGAAGAGTVAAAPGTALEEALGTVPVHPVTTPIATKPITARPRTGQLRPRIDPMAHDASPASHEQRFNPLPFACLSAQNRYFAPARSAERVNGKQLILGSDVLKPRRTPSRSVIDEGGRQDS
jgi:hypothetical protein